MNLKVNEIPILTNTHKHLHFLAFCHNFTNPLKKTILNSEDNDFYITALKTTCKRYTVKLSNVGLSYGLTRFIAQNFNQLPIARYDHSSCITWETYRMTQTKIPL